MIDPAWDRAAIDEAISSASQSDDHEDIISPARQRALRVDNLVAMRLRDFRVARGVHQSALAKAIGVSSQQIQKYENGENRISASALFGIAQALGVSISVFFESAEDQSGGEASFVDDQSADLFRNFSRIQSPQVRAAIVDLVRRLAAS